MEYMVSDERMAALTMSGFDKTAEYVACIACDGSPKAPNDPCGLCGTSSAQAEAAPIALTYTNYKGETATRTITPRSIWFGSTEWHPEPQYLLRAFDHDKQADRDFALKGFGRHGVPSPEGALADEILAELTRARSKFPGKNVTFAALVEEIGELATATFEEGRDRVRKEAVQVAVMAMRMVLDGDHTFDAWRAMNGLDPLVADDEVRS